MPQPYEPEFKHQIVRLRRQEGRTYASLTQEYGIAKATISNWCEQFSKECQAKEKASPKGQNEAERMKEIQKLRKELEESKKETLFLKKAAFFAKEIGEWLTDLSKFIMNYLVSAGCSGGWGFYQMLTITF